MRLSNCQRGLTLGDAGRALDRFVFDLVPKRPGLVPLSGPWLMLSVPARLALQLGEMQSLDAVGLAPMRAANPLSHFAILAPRSSTERDGAWHALFDPVRSQ